MMSFQYYTIQSTIKAIYLSSSEQRLSDLDNAIIFRYYLDIT